MELKIIGGVVGLFLVYLTVLYFVNREKAKKLIDSLMVGLEWLAQSEIIVSKKDKLYEQFSTLIDLYLVKLPFAKTALKWFVEFAMDKYIESRVPTMNSTIAPVVKEVIRLKTEEAINVGIEKGVEKLTEAITATPQPSTNETVVDLAKVILESESKGVVSIFGKVMKEGDKPKPDFEVGVGIARKL